MGAMRYDDYETLKITRDGKILTVAFNRPELRNATNAQMHRELMRVFPEISQDEETNVVILTGEGKAFTAGGDINQMKYDLDHPARFREGMAEAKRILFGMIDCDRPIIAKINGAAVGLGSTLAVACDITIASETAKIADPHVNIGLVAGDGGALLWPMMAGHARARMLLLTGEVLTGRQAADIGLITEAVPADQLDARVNAIAEKIANGASVAIRGTKRALTMAVRQALEAQLDAHLGFEALSYMSEDHRIAVDAFVEGKPPVFTGR
jgi:enoyl-CoA hydratase